MQGAFLQHTLIWVLRSSPWLVASHTHCATPEEGKDLLQGGGQ